MYTFIYHDNVVTLEKLCLCKLANLNAYFRRHRINMNKYVHVKEEEIYIHNN